MRSVVDVTGTSVASRARAQAWLARNGMAPKFGSRPIGWYRAHVDSALKYLEKRACRVGALPTACRVRAGTVYALGFPQDAGGSSKFVEIATVDGVFAAADEEVRQRGIKE